MRFRYAHIHAMCSLQSCDNCHIEQRDPAPGRWKEIVLCTIISIILAIPFGVVASNIKSFSRDLAAGSKGSDVKALQQKLFTLGYLKTAPTGYFGNMTKVALARWQDNAGILPAIGYFGLKSRARFNSDIVDPPSPPLPSDAIVQPMSNNSNSISIANVPASGLRVALSPQNPSSGILISDADTAASKVPVLGITFTAGTGSNALIQELKFHKIGTLPDNAITDAYIIRDDVVIMPYTSMNEGVIRFTGLNITVPAGQTQTLWLAVDPTSGLNPGNMALFTLPSATNIIATDASGSAAAVDGTFPINGNVFRIISVSNPPLATLTVSPLTIGGNVTPPSLNHLVASWNFNIGNNGALLKGLRLVQAGEADVDAIQNMKLFVNGVQSVAVPGLEDDGSVYFNTDKPAVLHTGSNSIEVYADVMGSPTDDVRFEIFNPYDILAIDSQYGTPIHGQADKGTDINIEGATLIITNAR